MRNGLTEVAATKRAVAGKNEAVEVLFAYLTGPEFRQRVDEVEEQLFRVSRVVEAQPRLGILLGDYAAPPDGLPSFTYCAVMLTRLGGMDPLRSEPSSRSVTRTE